MLHKYPLSFFLFFLFDEQTDELQRQSGCVLFTPGDGKNDKNSYTISNMFGVAIY